MGKKVQTGTHQVKENDYQLCKKTTTEEILILLSL